MAETKSHLIRINNSQISDSKTSPEVKKVGVGLVTEDGTTKKGSIFVSSKAVTLDKNTKDLPDHMKKSYVALSPGKEYNFVSGYGENYKTEKITGADIVAQNRAYMKERTAARSKALESEMPAQPSVEEEVQLS